MFTVSAGFSDKGLIRKPNIIESDRRGRCFFFLLQNSSITTGLKTVATVASLISWEGLVAPSLIIKMPRINVSCFTWRQEIKHPVDTTARYLIACRPVTICDAWRAFVRRHICCRWWSDWSIFLFIYFFKLCVLPVDICFWFSSRCVSSLQWITRHRKTKHKYEWGIRTLFNADRPFFFTWELSTRCKGRMRKISGLCLQDIASQTKAIESTFFSFSLLSALCLTYWLLFGCKKKKGGI